MSNVYLRFGKDAFKYETKPNEPKAGAYLFEDGEEKIWLPKSQVIHFRDDGETLAVTLPDWLVKKNPILQEYLDPEWIDAGCPD